MNEIHSCGYYCDKPACVKAQRDELRSKYFDTEKDAARYRKLCNEQAWPDDVSDAIDCGAKFAIDEAIDAWAVND